MKAYKGFDKNMRCRDFQFEVGKEYEEKCAKLCECGCALAWEQLPYESEAKS